MLKTVYIKLSQASLLLPIFAGFSNYKSLSLPFKILIYFFVVAAGFEVQASLTKAIYKNNMPGLHLYTLIEFLMFSAVYYLNIRRDSIVRLFIGVNAFIFLGIAVLDAFYIDGIMALNILSRTYSSIFMISYTLYFLNYLFRKDDIIYIWEYPMFWVCTGALIYFGGNFLYFMLKKYLAANAIGIEWKSHLIHAALNIISNVIYAQSFRCFKKHQTFS